MNYKTLFCIVFFLVLNGCAAQQEPVNQREPKRLITQDDYEDLKIKPRKKEPVEVDYKEGVTVQNINIKKEVNAKEANQRKFINGAAFGSLDDLKLRHEKGARVNFRNADGEPVLLGLLKGPYDNQTFLKLKYLISIGAQVNFKGKSETSNNTTPLDAAVWHTSYVFKSDTASNNAYYAEQILKYLIDEGANVSGTDDRGGTPLHTAAKSDNLIAAKLLIEAGAEVMPKDYDGKTPLDFTGSGEMTTLLKEYEAVDMKDVMPEDADKQEKKTQKL
jgi:ankyrin repeat protein